jgi:2-polyprenyl-6-hydroxyphenyl methylase/3-demethylubiquinone-9 3-methyltransferase
MTRRSYVEHAPSPREYCALFKEAFGPTVAVYSDLADQPERTAKLDREFLEFATRSNRGPADGPAEYHYEYLLVVARKRG